MEGPLDPPNRLPRLPIPAVTRLAGRLAQWIVGRGDLQDLLELLDRLVLLALLHVDFAQVEVWLGHARVGGDGLLERLGCLLEPAKLEHAKAQLIVVADGWVGLGRGAVGRLGLVAAAGVDQHIA